MKPCSMCGNKPAVCVDRMHKGTYWLCGDCAGERIEELIHLRARIEALEKALAHNIRERAIRMIGQGYGSPEQQQPFFPGGPWHILDGVFAEDFVAALAAKEETDG